MNVFDASLALIWGLASGSALIIGATIGLYANLSRHTIALVMGFGSGILIAVVAFDLVDEAFLESSLVPVVIAFLTGAALFTAVSVVLATLGARHRKRSHGEAHSDNAQAIAIGSIIDNVPESILIGLTLIDGEGIALATFIAIFLSNVPEALSSSAGMKAAGRKTRNIFLIWAITMAMSGIMSFVGYTVFAGFPLVATMMQAAGAGALLAMISDTMIPEAFAETRNAAGLVVAIGFTLGFALSHGLG